MQGDHHCGQPMEEREEEDRVEEAASLQRASQVEEEIKVREEEGGRVSPRDKNKEGLKDPGKAREKEVPVGSIQDPKRAEGGAEIRPGRAQEQEQSQARGAQTNHTGSSMTPPQLIPLTQRGDKGKDPKGIALEQRKEGKRSNYCKEILQGNKKGNIQRRQRDTESQEEGTGKGDIPQQRSRGRIRGRPQGNAGKG